jgi:hypothetical protein
MRKSVFGRYFGDRRVRFALLIAISGVVLAGVLTLAILFPAVVRYLNSPSSSRINLPSAAAYPAHATLGTVLSALGVSPRAAGIQWVKAASHAERQSEVDRAARGIADARQRAGEDGQLDAILCGLLDRSAPTVQVAILRSDVRCGSAQIRWRHQTTLIVYVCPDGCVDVEMGVRALQEHLSREGRGLEVLSIPRDGEKHQIFVATAGRLLTLDHFDRAQILAFHTAQMNQRPK